MESCYTMKIFNKYINIKRISIWIIIFFIVFLPLFLGIPIISQFLKKDDAETLLYSSLSPNETYYLEAYRVEPDATVDFSAKVYLVNGNSRKLIYNAYHERDVSIVWLNDNIVIINNRELDLSQNEIFDWRRTPI